MRHHGRGVVPKNRSARSTAPAVSSVSPAAAGQRRRRHAPEVQRAELRRRHHEVGRRSRPAGVGAVWTALDEPPAGVGGEERVGELDDEAVLDPVATRREAARGIDDAHPEVVGDLGDADPARVGQAEADRVVEGASDALHVRDEIDFDDELPEAGLHVVVERVEVEDLQCVCRDPARPVLADAVPREAVDLPIGRLVHDRERRARPAPFGALAERVRPV